MKVLSILPAPYSPSGLIFARRQIASLEKLGAENLTFIIPSKDVTLLTAFHSFRELKKTVRSFCPDIVHVHYGLLYSFMAAFSSCKPLVITFQGSDINTVKSKSFLRNFSGQLLSNLASLRAGTIICVSSNLLDNIWWGEKKAVIIPSGINMEEFHEMDRVESRKILKWKTDEKVILFNANNPSVKRLDIALETLDLLKKEVPGVRLEILDGAIPDSSLIPVMLNASDALLICSDSEGSPTMVKEAMACNLPVIGVDVGDVTERLKGVSRCSVVAQDPRHLSDAIAEILGSNSRSDGRQKLVSDGLTEEKVVNRIYELYQQLVAAC